MQLILKKDISCMEIVCPCCFQLLDRLTIFFLTIYKKRAVEFMNHDKIDGRNDRLDKFEGDENCILV